MAQAAAQAQISASEQNLDAALASVTTSVINSPVVPPAPSQPAQQVQQQMAPTVPQPPPQQQPQPAPVHQASNQRTTAVVMNQSQLHQQQQQQQHQRQNNVHIPVVPNERTEPVIPYSRIISNQNFNSNVQTDKQHNQKQKDERTVSTLRVVRLANSESRIHDFIFLKP